MARLVANKTRYNKLGAQSITVNAPDASVFSIQGCKTVCLEVIISAFSGATGASAAVQLSNDGINWYTQTTPASQNVTANGGLIFTLVDPTFLYARMTYVVATGSYSATAYITAQSITN